MKAKIKKVEKGGRRDQQVLLDTLDDALKNDSQAKGGIVVNEENELAIMYYESGHMAEVFGKFPEIVLVDGTYIICKQSWHATLLLHGRRWLVWLWSKCVLCCYCTGGFRPHYKNNSLF